MKIKKTSRQKELCLYENCIYGEFVYLEIHYKSKGGNHIFQGEGKLREKKYLST